MSYCTSDLMSWGTPFQASKFYIHILPTKHHSSQKYVLWLHDYLWVVKFWELIPSLHFTILNAIGLWLVVPFFFLGKCFIICRKRNICMYKYYYVLNFCLFICSLFGSTGLNFYPLDNEVAKTPGVMISYSSIKQDCFSQYWFRNTCFAGLVPWWVIDSRRLMWKRDIYRRSF